MGVEIFISEFSRFLKKPPKSWVREVNKIGDISEFQQLYFVEFWNHSLVSVLELMRLLQNEKEWAKSLWVEAPEGQARAFWGRRITNYTPCIAAKRGRVRGFSVLSKVIFLKFGKCDLRFRWVFLTHEHDYKKSRKLKTPLGFLDFRPLGWWIRVRIFRPFTT